MTEEEAKKRIWAESIKRYPQYAKGSILPPCTDRLMCEILTEHFLGKDYYIADPVGYEQGNTIEVLDILRKTQQFSWKKFIKSLFK